MTDRELDALVAEHVMGWTDVHHDTESEEWFGTPIGTNCAFPIPDHSGRISSAWRVVEKMQENTANDDHLQIRHRGHGIYLACFAPLPEMHWLPDNPPPQAVQALTAPRAICLAALKAVSAEVEA